MTKKDGKNLRQYFRWEVLIPLLVLLAVSIHDFKSKTAFKVIVDGDSMSPTYDNMEAVWASSMYSRIIRGDVVVIQFNNESTIIKRVLYLPGDKFWVMNYDQTHWTPIPDDTVVDFSRLNLWPMRKIAVPANFIWLEGDNKLVSYDSRIYGLFDMEYIKGVVSPWRSYDSKNYPALVQRLYDIRKQGKSITKEKFIGHAPISHF
jgi:signal peptidase I